MQRVGLAHAQPGMVTKSNIYGADGQVLLRSGIELSSGYIDRLKTMGIGSLYVRNEQFEGVDIPQMLAEEIRLWAIRTVQECFEQVRKTETADIQKLRDVARTLTDEVTHSKNPMFHLVDIRTIDDYLYGHSVNVCVLSILMGMALGYDDLKMRELSFGALVHDVGMLLVDQDNGFLNKAGLYTPEEKVQIEMHTYRGFDLLRKSRSAPLLSSHVAFQHHERPDGTGYPRKLKAREIHEYARIVAIADVYDALISDRSYRPALLPHEAHELMMASRESQFDASMLDLFFKNVAIYPLGSVVQLSNGDIGVIVKVHATLPTRPTVKIIANKNGQTLGAKQEIDLTRQLTLFIQRVLREDEVFKLGILTAVMKNLAQDIEHHDEQKKALGKVVSAPVADALVNKGINLGGEQRLATVVVTNVDSFATVTSGLSPQQVVEILNQYFDEVAIIAEKYKGTIMGCHGDSLTIIFNAPMSDPVHGPHAVQAVIEICRLMARNTFGVNHLVLKTRAGVSTGTVLAGNIGPKQRLEYNIMGNAVKIATALEKACKELGTTVLLDETTYDIVKKGLPCQQVGMVPISAHQMGAAYTMHV